MLLRNVTMRDLEKVSEIEHKCFPVTEACDKEKLKDRIKTYPNHFFLLQEKDKIIGFIDGFVSNEKDLSDLMYRCPSMHDEEGRWQMIFGVCILPAYQHRGYAHYMLNHFIQKVKEEHREGIVLTCKEEKISFYEEFGFVNEGESISSHGGVTWYQMRLTF